MNLADRAELYERVSALRGATFDLIANMTGDGAGLEAEEAGVIVRLQGVANRLGAVEEQLNETSGEPPRADTAPAEREHAGPAYSQDAAIVIGLAATALPFATTLEDEAERWMRIMRLHGHVGSALQALGVSEAPLETRAEPREVRMRSQQSRKVNKDPVVMVEERSRGMAYRRGSRSVSTVDVLFAVLQVYGSCFDRALYEHGASRDELLGRLVGPRTQVDAA